MEILTLNEYRQMTATQLTRAIRQGMATKEEVLALAYDSIQASQLELNNIVELFPIEQTKAYAQSLVDTGQTFYGVPILLKGLGHALKDANNSIGVQFMREVTFKETNSFVQALIDAGFIIIGQTTYPQLGWLNVTHSELFGSTGNPWDYQLNAGGSSGGSAAAVASGQVPLATSSDAGGSTRIPASWTGLIGLDPSKGIIKGNATEDRNQTSHFALMKSMEDLSCFFDTLLAPEARLEDKDLSPSTRFAYCLENLSGAAIGENAKLAILETVQFLQDHGFQVDEVEYPINGPEMMYHYCALASSYAKDFAEHAQSYLERELQAEDVERLTWGLLQAGMSLDASDLDRAWDYATVMTEQLGEFYRHYDILITPTTNTSAVARDYQHLTAAHAEQLKDMSALSKDERINLIYEQWYDSWTKTPFTQIGNLSGNPSLSLPLYKTAEGLPIGVLFNGPFGSDKLLINIGTFLEKEGQFMQNND